MLIMPGPNNIPIILSTSEDEETCPNCHKPEDIKEVCRHCGHEYVDDGEGFSGLEIIFGIPVFLFLLTVCCAIFLGVMAMIFVPIFNWIDGDRCLDNVGHKVSCYSSQQVTKDEHYTLGEAYGDEAKIIWGVVKRIF